VKHKGLSMEARRELIQANYKEYQGATKKRRGEILKSLEDMTGMNRDYLGTVLSRYGKDGKSGAECGKARGKGSRKGRKKGKGGRQTVYGGEFVRVLTAIWADYGRPCGKLLVPQIRSMIDQLCASRDPYYGIDGETRNLLMKVSAAQVDIVLKPARKGFEIRGISTTHSASVSLRSQVPVQTHFDRDTLEPGFFGFDTVAHCGESASGHFCKSLTGTEVFSGWIEERALLNSANRWVKEAISNIRSEIPFPMKGGQIDNGTEFINRPLLEWCLERHIKLTRSRPYHKNDNCYTEQKNYDAVRKTVGYYRFDTPEEYKALAEVYRYLCPYYNYFRYSFKLLAKEKQANGRYKKIYEKKPKTPCERLLESPLVSEECKAELLRRKSLYNPVVLNAGINKAVAELLRINREKGYNETNQEINTSCQEEGQAITA